MKSGNLNFLEPSGLLQACNGTALPLHWYIGTDVSEKPGAPHLKGTTELHVQDGLDYAEDGEDKPSRYTYV